MPALCGPWEDTAVPQGSLGALASTESSSDAALAEHLLDRSQKNPPAALQVPHSTF